MFTQQWFRTRELAGYKSSRVRQRLQYVGRLQTLLGLLHLSQAVADPRGGGDGGDCPPPREVEKNTSSTTVVNFCADFVGVPVISVLFSNQAPSTINIMKIAVCRMHLVRYQLLLPRLVATS